MGLLTLDRVEMVDNQGAGTGGLVLSATATIRDGLIARNTAMAVPNALVDIGGQVGRTGEFTFTPPAGAVSQAFVVRSSNANAPTTLPLDVVDTCGVWSTLVGGGPGVVGVGGGGGGGGGGVGTFTLSPSAAVNVVGAIVPVQFSWSVPAPSVWRSLTGLELRLRDEQGVAWGVRWEEVGDRFVVTDTRSPALFALVGARAQGSGPTGQSVTLTLPLQVLEAAAGGHFTIEVRATDDSGAVQGFDGAGALSIEALPPRVSENKEDSPHPLTEERRWQRSHGNAGSREDERIEGDVLGVDCAARPPVVTIGNRDGEVTVQLRGEAVGDCAQVQPGQYLEAGGEKIHEQLFVADRISAE